MRELIQMKNLVQERFVIKSLYHHGYQKVMRRFIPNERQNRFLIYSCKFCDQKQRWR